MTRIVKHPKDLLAMVGETFGPTEWLLIEQDRIDQFADATGDHQWIHVDPIKAAAGPFGACIAHGYLTLSLANKFLPELMTVEQVTMGVNYGCEKIRFPNTVKVGQRIRGLGELISCDEKPSGVHVVVRITIDVDGEDRPACVVDTISRFYYASETD